MEPHSRPCSSQNGTLRLPQALLLLLSTVLAGPTRDPVTQTDSLPLWLVIRNTAYRLFALLNPFSVTGHWTTTISVGMVKLTALCGIGSAFWLWSNRKRNATVADLEEDSELTNGEHLAISCPRSHVFALSSKS